jgi:hypothetical protein
LSTYPAVVNLKKALHAVLLQFEAAKVPSQNLADHAATSATLHSFNFCASVYFLTDILRPLHQLHAQLQSPRLILQEVESHYINARSHMQHFLDDGCTEETTPNCLHFVQEVVEGKIDEKIIPKLKHQKIAPSGWVISSLFTSVLKQMCLFCASWQTWIVTSRHPILRCKSG